MDPDAYLAALGKLRRKFTSGELAMRDAASPGKEDTSGLPVRC